MSTNLTLTALIAILVATGVYLLLERSLTRVILGVVLLGTGANLLLLLSSGRAGRPPIVGVSEPDEMSDALPQALILTAIVIAFGVTAFVLAMAYRSWQLNGVDDVKDDLEDALVRRRDRRRSASQQLADLQRSALEPDDEEDPARESLDVAMYPAGTNPDAETGPLEEDQQ